MANSVLGLSYSTGVHHAMNVADSGPIGSNVHDLSAAIRSTEPFAGPREADSFIVDLGDDVHAMCS